MVDNGNKILTDPAAESAEPGKAAFLARPKDAPVYHGFPIIEESETEGWRIGAITEFIGNDEGDAFVVAPDGSRAGLVWEVSYGEFGTICEPEPDRWGVYAVWFPNPIENVDDFVSNFRSVLPALQRQFEIIKGNKE
ncbi:MAG TPA: hypothetical protein VK468_03695 [Pyrinomonadaceae bacterium]|nr:hypothetical protein [Pyrinomonadaceae bacterium]